MNILSEIRGIKAPKFSELEYYYGETGANAYQDGFNETKTEIIDVVSKYDELIAKLFDALCNRHADDLVDELKEEYGL